MAIKYTYDKDSYYIDTVVTEMVSINQVSEYIDKIINNESIENNFYELVDFTTINGFDFGYYQTNELVDLFIKLKKHKKYLGTCVVVNSDVAKGMSNMFNVVWEDKGLILKTFNSRNDAINFIESNVT